MSSPAPFDTLPTERLHRMTLPARAAVFRQGDQTRGAFFVETGRVLLLPRHSEDGEIIWLHPAHPGDTFAKADLFSDSYHYDAIAQGPATLLRRDRHSVPARIQSDPVFASALCQRHAGQVQGYRRDIALRAVRSAEGRVLAAIDRLAASPGNAQFAALIGLTPEATHRAPSALG